jgi:hypothetical protein
MPLEIAVRGLNRNRPHLVQREDWRLCRSADKELAMKSHLSLTSVSVAVMMFAVTVAMHEAARANRLSQTVTPVAIKLVELAELLRPSE